MAKRGRKPGKKPDSIIVKNIIIKPNQRSTQDIGSWRTALRSAESDNPRRVKLYDLYEDILLDGTLSSAVDKRIEAVVNSGITFKNSKQEVVEEVQNLIDKSVFETIVTEILSAKFWGHSLIEMNLNTEIPAAELVSRKNVEPRKGIILKNQSDTNGMPYRTPEQAPYLLEVGRDRDLGLLLKAAQYVIYKRGGFGDWAQFAELFGMPFRTGKYDEFDEAGRIQLEEALDKAGSAAWAVIPKSTELDTVANNSNGNGEVHEKFKMACDKEILITILGQTMTTMDTSGSGYAQGKVHQEIESSKHQSDKRFVIRTLNEKLIPILEHAGYPVKDGSFYFEEEDSRSIKDKVDTAVTLRKNGTPVSDDYLYEITNIPKPDNYDALKKAQQEKQQTPGINPKQKDPKKETKQKEPKKDKEVENNSNLLKFYNTLKGFFVTAPDNKRGLNTLVNKLYAVQNSDNTVTPSWTEDILKILKDLREKTASPEDLNKQLFQSTAKKLLKAGSSALDGDLDDITYNTPDYNFLIAMRENIYNFSGAKCYQHLKALNELLLDEKGNIVPFHKFRDNAEDYRQQAMQVEGRYNELWLKSEYNNAIAQSQAAKRWKEFEEDADIFPNLEYRTAGDSNVREEHQRLKGVIRPINDSFWNKYYPPNSWGCRCRAVPTDAEPTKAEKMGIDPIFNNNVGKTGYIFPENHPYFTSNNIIKEDIKHRVTEFGKEEYVKVSKQLYGDYAKTYQQMKFDNESGGFICTEKGWSDSQELDISKQLMAMGERIVLLKPKDIDGLKNPDAILNGTLFEFKTVKGSYSSINNNIKRGKKQARHILINIVEDIDKSILVDALKSAYHSNSSEVNGIICLYKKRKAFLHKSELEKEELIDAIIQKCLFD